MGYKKGAKAERELIEFLTSLGFTCIRSAGSGKLSTPDVIASNGNRIIAFECKAPGKNFIYISKKQIESLKEFGRKFGCETFIAIKFPRKKWRMKNINELKEMNGKNYRIEIENTKKLIL